jgi:TrmH family RNA methyltransferase
VELLNIINSRNNNQVKEAKKLKNRKYRDQNNRFLIEGFRFVDEALMSQFEISAIFIYEAVSEKWMNHIENC